MARAVRSGAIGPAAILVNNDGGDDQDAAARGRAYEHLELAINVNIWGVVHCTTRSSGDPAASREGSNRQRLDHGGTGRLESQVPYTMTKFAVRGFSEAPAHGLLDSNVRVNRLPGHIARRSPRTRPTLTDAEKSSCARSSRNQARPRWKWRGRSSGGIPQRPGARVDPPETYIIDTSPIAARFGREPAAPAGSRRSRRRHRPTARDPVRRSREDRLFHAR